MTTEEVKKKVINNPEAAMMLLIYGYGYSSTEVDRMSSLEIIDRADG